MIPPIIVPHNTYAGIELSLMIDTLINGLQQLRDQMAREGGK